MAHEKVAVLGVVLSVLYFIAQAVPVEVRA